MTRGKSGFYWRRTIITFSPSAVLLTGGASYTIPSGATTMKAWAVGAGHGCAGNSLSPTAARGGSIAHKTWSVSGGQAVNYSINTSPQYQFGPPAYTATGSTAHTTVTYDGQTIRGFFGYSGGNANDETAEGSGITWLQFSGGDGFALGGGHQTNSPNSGYYLRGGAAGGNSASPSCGDAGYRRNVMTDISGLKAALALAGAKITDDCANPQAFGNGNMDTKYSGALSPGLGGGAINVPAGGGAVILYFT